ncbi:MAG TPA: spermidine synthase [Vicinamibacteria bacterium]|nr:spermidine synthase [Vicinamibacteria bacterium]
MRAALCAVFFVSGAAALLFETLWFRQAGLALGNSVWASSLVTASFMAGLAIGSAVAARHADRLRRPLVVYALLEILVGASGTLLVVTFPWLPAVLAPGLGQLGDVTFALNAARAAISFVVLLLPATAMGLTLPLLARVLARGGLGFGSNLGLLYGFNTLGAVVGAVAGEGFLIEAVGVRGAGFVAAGLNGAAALAALALARGREALRPGETTPVGPPTRTGLRVMGATFASGAALLALEVVWFRLLAQFCAATSFSFAVMLAVILVGIAAGGLLAAQLARRPAVLAAMLPLLALLAGVVTVAAYTRMPGVLDALGGRYLFAPSSIALAAAALMLPTSIVSGLFFTVSGMVLHAGGRGGAEGQAVGLLTLANTCGALAGALMAGFALLPTLGVELSLFVVVVLYGLIAAITVGLGGARPPLPILSLLVGMLALFGLSVALFPFGLMRNDFLRRSVTPFLRGGSRLVLVREGLTETLSYTRRDLFGEPVDHRLIVNGFSMSGSFFSAARYMRLFVFLPVALHPRPRNALLISYGVGLTAQALTDTAGLESIDVVDISADVLDAARSVHPVPGPMPLDDPRVRIHIEDGRFFLLTTRRSYDLITGEPPPPRQNGIVNLYSKEYFGLVRRRLRPGGIASYWLPVDQLSIAETRAIARGFCDVFEDCSLWTGSGYEWVLMGTQRAGGPVPRDAFERQWNDPAVRPDLDELGFERPELVGSTFLADRNGLLELVAGAPPLDDDHPLRLGMRFPQVIDASYGRLMETGAARKRFEDSALIRRLWPSDLRQSTLEAFGEQHWVNLALLANSGHRSISAPEMREILTATRLRAPVLWSLGSSLRSQMIAQRARAAGLQAPLLDETLGIGALAERRYADALDRLSRARHDSPASPRLKALEELARSLAPSPH